MNTLAATFSSSKIAYGGLGFVLALISGFILSRSGRPLNSTLFTVHKLIAVGTIILIGVGIRNLAKAAAGPGLYPIFIVITGLFFLALIVSGALLSFDKLAVLPVLRIHQVAPLLALLASATTIYLLAAKLELS